MSHWDYFFSFYFNTISKNLDKIYSNKNKPLNSSAQSLQIFCWTKIAIDNSPPHISIGDCGNNIAPRKFLFCLQMEQEESTQPCLFVFQPTLEIRGRHPVPCLAENEEENAICHRITASKRGRTTRHRL